MRPRRAADALRSEELPTGGHGDANVELKQRTEAVKALMSFMHQKKGESGKTKLQQEIARFWNCTRNGTAEWINASREIGPRALYRASSLGKNDRHDKPIPELDWAYAHAFARHRWGQSCWAVTSEP